MNTEFQRDLGKHDAQIEALERDIQLLRKDLIRVFEKLDQINTTLATAKGGWKTMMWVAGASAALGGFIVKIAPILQSR